MTKRGFDSQPFFVIFIIFIISIICLISGILSVGCSFFFFFFSIFFFGFLVLWFLGFLVSSISESVISRVLHLPEIVLPVVDDRSWESHADHLVCKWELCVPSNSPAFVTAIHACQCHRFKSFPYLP